MKLLLHICCGPCAIYPVKVLREQAVQLMGYYYRSNIHPYTECLRRQQTLETYADTIGLQLIVDRAYDLEGHLRATVFRETQRCLLCYHRRLKATALVAKRGRFDAFSTTLLYSKFQQHDAIRDTGKRWPRRWGFPSNTTTSASAGKKASPLPRRWACTGSNIADASTARKNATSAAAAASKSAAPH